jgi:hypothetical protein
MMGNDNHGDCVFAGIGHALQVMVMSQILPNAPAGIIHPADSEILGYYSKWAGFDPADPSTDQGADELTTLNLWRKEGFAGYSLLAYADPSPTNIDHIKQTIYLFGGAYVGIQMPDGWQGAALWDADMGDPGSWGGHAVYVPDYDADGLTAITWGMLQRISWDGFAQYVDEAHALVTSDWTPPPGFDSDTLQKDLSAITG